MQATSRGSQNLTENISTPNLAVQKFLHGEHTPQQVAV
uniref:Uncharacterized protein n=1 Tax=Arundo donax TaxID=35708 RepID=A0A0A9HXP2_ARUDO